MRVSHLLTVPVLLACWWLGGSQALAQQWTLHGSVAQGGQIDVVRGPSDRLHLISSRYYQFDRDGAVLVDEAVGDERQGSMDFPPAIAVGDDGSVHIVTRHGGDWTSGHDIRYRRRNASGSWDRDYLVGTPAKRNYVVGAAWAGPDAVYLSISDCGPDVWGDLHIWQAGAGSATLLGSIGGIWRADADSRMRGLAGHVFLVSGKPDGGGTGAYLLHAAPSGNLASSLQASMQTHIMGTYRTGFPDLFPDRSGSVHFTYGAQQSVYYNKYSTDGSKQLGSDVMVFDGLEFWHLESGLSAVAASDDGQTVVAVALRSDGSAGASNSELFWSYSDDGGVSWQPPQSLGVYTDGGEGRHRPRLTAVGAKFFLFYQDRANPGISLATLEMDRDGDSDGFPQSRDCNDSDPDVHPGADERCNGIDDDCDGDTDEGCSQDAGLVQDAGLDGGGTADAGVTDQDAGGSATGDAATDGSNRRDIGGVRGGCGCMQPAESGCGPWCLVVFLLPVLFRRRKKEQGHK